MIKMPKLMILSFLVLSGCNMNENSFNYDRGNACIIDYGRNGISVIVDGDNILVKNNTFSQYPQARLSFLSDKPVGGEEE